MTSRSASAAQLILLHVVEYVPVEPMGEALLPAVQIEGELVERARKRIAELAAQGRARRRPSSSCTPATSRPKLVRVAQERGVDLIVLGSRERHGLSILFNQTEDTMLHAAPCDVLAVRWNKSMTRARAAPDPRRRQHQLRRRPVESGEGRFVFAYTITIRNEGSKPARLVTRHWLITDANGKVQEVRRRRRRRRAAAPAARPGLSLFERRDPRDAGRLDAGQVPAWSPTTANNSTRRLRPSGSRCRACCTDRGRMAIYAVGDVQGCLDELEMPARPAALRRRQRPALVRRRPRQPWPALARHPAFRQVARRCCRSWCSATTTCTCSRSRAAAAPGGRRRRSAADRRRA